LKVFANVKIAMQYFDNFGGGQMPQMPPAWLRAGVPQMVRDEKKFGNHWPNVHHRPCY